MSGDLGPPDGNAVWVLPAPGQDDLVPAIGHRLTEGGEPVPRTLLSAALVRGGLLGRTVASWVLLDGSSAGRNKLSRVGARFTRSLSPPTERAQAERLYGESGVRLSTTL
jgi:hypothetical protein